MSRSGRFNSSGGGSGSKSYPRHYRVASLLRRGLPPIVAACGHPGVTIRRVSLNRDCSAAVAHYALLGDLDGDREKAMALRESLNQKAHECRKRLAASLNMRTTPALSFKPDSEGMAADAMQQFLDGIPVDSNSESDSIVDSSAESV